MNKFCFGAIYNGRLWEKELRVSALLHTRRSHSHRAISAGIRTDAVRVPYDFHAQAVAIYDARKNPGGVRGACWSTVHRCAIKGLQNLSLTECVWHFEIDTPFHWVRSKSKPFKYSQSLTSAAFACCTNNTFTVYIGNLLQCYCNSISFAAQLRPGPERQVLFQPFIHSVFAKL